jgi:CBS domain containing-hemolysin-like protein
MISVLLSLAGCLIAAGFFAGLETGLLASDRVVLQQKRENGVLYARAAEYLLSKPQRLLGTTLIGHNIFNVTAAVILTNYFDQLGLRQIAWIGVVFMTFVFVVFDDLIPKSFYRRHADGLTVRMTPLLFLFYLLFLPLYLILNTVVQLILFVTGQYHARREEVRSRSDLRFLVHMAGQEVGLSGEDQKIIEEILDFREQSAREVMIPFHKLPVVNVTQTAQDVARLAVETGSRFIPVSRYRTDNMIGYVDSIGLLWSGEQSLENLARKAVFYPETSLIPDLLLDMNRRALHVAFLSDEYGGIAGMITPSQIIGDIVHFVPEQGRLDLQVDRLGPGHFRVDGETDLEDLSHVVGLVLRSSYNRTIGGYICERLGVIPDEGARYEEGGYVFTVAERDDRRIRRVEIERKR